MLKPFLKDSFKKLNTKKKKKKLNCPAGIRTPSPTIKI